MSLHQSELPSHVHFVGVCGKGTMSLAASLKALGVRVSGSDDNVYGDAASWLRRRGIDLNVGFSESALDEAPDAVVIGRTYGRGNVEVEAVLERRLRYYSLPGFIADHFLEGARNMVVAGSKGKTTTTAMGAWIMHRAGLNPGYMVAGRAIDLPEQAEFGGRQYHVVEGDDYSSLWWDDNPKFCYYHPEVVTLTNILPDHPEHHTNVEVTARHFTSLISQIPRSGLLVSGDESPLVSQVVKAASCAVVRVGFDAGADMVIRDWSQTDDGNHFTIEGTRFQSPLFGRLNALNAAMAAAGARHFGVSLEASAEALRSFHGVRGRMECLGEVNDITCYTDMGYLPECMGPTIEALQRRHQGRRLVFFFQPHIIEGVPVSHGKVIDALSRCGAVMMADVYRPLSYPLRNAGFSDDICRELVDRGVEAHRVGPLSQAVDETVKFLQPGDVLLGIVHPKHQDELQRLVRSLAGTLACAS